MDRNRELVPDNEPGKRKSADHWTLFGRIVFNTCSWVSEEEWSCQEGNCVVMSGEHFPRKLMMQNQYIHIS